VQVLDRHGIPDGLPFIVDGDGSLTDCELVNTYLLTAWRQRAYDLDSLRSFHAYHLARLLRFVRARRCGESVDLTATIVHPDVSVDDFRHFLPRQAHAGERIAATGHAVAAAPSRPACTRRPIPRSRFHRAPAGLSPAAAAGAAP
jgi:hypothetical protein